MLLLTLVAAGNILYHHASGFQDIEPDSPAIDPDSTISWSAAAKIVTNIAALQLVQKGIVGLDEPIRNHVPHIDALPLISRLPEDSDSEFIVRNPSKPITLRHLLTYIAGFNTPQNDLVQEYLSKNDLGVPEDAPNLVKMFSIPLLFEPGEGFLYGSCIYWMQHLVGTIGGNFQEYVKEHILNPLGMSTATYVPDKVPEVWARKLRMVEKVDGKFVPQDEHTRGFTCSVLDIAKLLGEFISPNPKLLQ